MIVKTKDKSENGDVYKELDKFGKFQLQQYFLISLAVLMVSMSNVNYIFVAEDINHRCRVPACDNKTSTAATPEWWPDNTDLRCLKPVVKDEESALVNGACTNMSFHETAEQCTEWIYEHNNSIVEHLNLGCHSWKATIVGSIHNAGMIVSMSVTGWIADKIGRKPTIIICAVGGTIGVFKVFANNYYVYLSLEFLESVFASGLYTVAIVLLIEVGGESKRVAAGVIFAYAIYVGEVTFALVALALKFWKWIIIVVYAPMILFVPYIYVLKESTRWQMLRGKMDEAKDTFKSVIKRNKLNLSANEILNMDDAELRLKFNVEILKEKENINDIFRSKEIMIRLLVGSFCFFTSSFVYYGLVVHSIFLPGNKYTNFVLASLTAFPGDIVAYYTFNRYGRKISLQCGYFFSGISLMAQAYAPDSISWLKVLLFLCGKLCVVVCFTGIYTYSLELFPTSVRGSLVGTCNTAARVGSMLAPLTPLLTSELSSLPSILFSSTAVIAALLLTFTPETKTLPLFDTITQVDAYRQKLTTHL